MTSTTVTKLTQEEVEDFVGGMVTEIPRQGLQSHMMIVMAHNL